MLGVAVWLGITASALTIPAGTGPWPLVLAAAAVIVGAAGVARLVRLAALPGTATFDGQVIARWQEVSDSESGSSLVSHIAVDDGQRGWTFTGSSPYDRVALGDLVRVTVNPRSRKLLDLTVTGRPRTGTGAGNPGPPPPEPLLTAAEAAGLLGPGVRTMALPSAGGRGVLHKGRASSLSIIIVSGRLADINLARARKRGMPLPGIGDEAWLLNRDRIVIAVVGDQTAKLIVSGRAGARDPEVLPTLAATVAGRLATQAARNA